MNIYTIYKATNVKNNKSYIGFDSKFPKRKSEHKSCFSSQDTVFYRAIRKYGWENFTWEILYQSKELDHTKNVMENYFITEYNSYIHFKESLGYNMTLGGDGIVGHIKSEETKNKTKMFYLENYGVAHNSQLEEIKEKKKSTSMKNWGKEFTLSVPEIREKGRLTCLEKYGVENYSEIKQNCVYCGKYAGISHQIFCSKNPTRTIPYDRNGENNPRFGANLSESTKEKQRAKLCKNLYSITLPNGIVITTNNLRKFCREHNLDSGNLGKVVSGKYSQHKGYVAKKLI